MKLFQQKTQVLTFSSCEEFLEQFQINENDYILASKTIYKKYFEPLNIKADVVFHSDYGKGEPTDIMIDKMLKDAHKKDYKRIIAIGGGSVLDCAKLFVIKDADNTIDLFTHKIPFLKDKELIAIPTTCGSGSEVSNISIAEITSMNTKLGLAVDPLYPDYAILLPELLADLPIHYFVTSAIDALIHASESFVSPKSNEYTELFSSKAITMIIKGFMQMAEHGVDDRLHHLHEFMVASNYAGIAFGNTGTGTVHAMSYPLSGVYHVTHGEANYQFFTEVFKTYQHLAPNGKIKEITALFATVLKCPYEDAYIQLERMFDCMLKRKPLHEYGMKEAEIETFTTSIIASQQRLLSNSYVPLSESDLKNIYTRLF